MSNLYTSTGGCIERHHLTLLQNFEIVSFFQKNHDSADDSYNYYKWHNDESHLFICTKGPVLCSEHNLSENLLYAQLAPLPTPDLLISIAYVGWCDVMGAYYSCLTVDNEHLLTLFRPGSSSSAFPAQFVGILQQVRQCTCINTCVCHLVLNIIISDVTQQIKIVSSSVENRVYRIRGVNNIMCCHAGDHCIQAL